MSSTSSEMLTNDQAASTPYSIEREGLLRMGGLYAWIIVTVAIILIAAMLAQIEHSKPTAHGAFERAQEASFVR